MNVINKISTMPFGQAVVAVILMILAVVGILRVIIVGRRTGASWGPILIIVFVSIAALVFPFLSSF